MEDTSELFAEAIDIENRNEDTSWFPDQFVN